MVYSFVAIVQRHSLTPSTVTPVNEIKLTVALGLEMLWWSSGKTEGVPILLGLLERVNFLIICS
jgi:hypothetical protein